MTVRLSILLGGLLWLLGCTSTGVGNPGFDSISLAITVDDRTPDSDALDVVVPDAAAPEADAALANPSDEESLPKTAVRHAILVLRELRWLPCDANLPATIVRGPFVLDLVAQRSVPAIPSVQVPETGFCGIDAPLRAARAPAALAGRSLFFDGVREDGALFIVYADMKATLRLRAKRDVRWGARSDEAEMALLWAFRPRRWLRQHEVELADATPWDDQMRAVVIDVDRHPALFLAIRRRLAGESTLYADREPDGTLDPADLPIGLGSDDAD